MKEIVWFVILIHNKMCCEIDILPTFQMEMEYLSYFFPPRVNMWIPEIRIPIQCPLEYPEYNGLFPPILPES